MARLLYKEQDIPKEKNIPNFIRVFQSTDPEKNPIRRLRVSGIIDESRQVQKNALKAQLMKVSKQV